MARGRRHSCPRHHARPGARLRREPTRTSIVNTIRDRFTQEPVSTDIWTAFAWCLGILIVAYALAMATYHRKIV